MTELEAAKLITALTAAFPDGWRFLDAEQQKATRAMYRHMLRDLDAHACAAACARLVATCKKMPSIAEIREATLAQVNGRRLIGGEAWGSVRKAIAREGLIHRSGRHKIPGEDFVFHDPVVLRVVLAMGWSYLCNMTDERSVADRARFIELYEQLARQRAEDDNVAEIAAPIPHRVLPPGSNHIRDIVAGLLPTTEPEPTSENAARVLDQHHQPE